MQDLPRKGNDAKATGLIGGANLYSALFLALNWALIIKFALHTLRAGEKRK